MVTKFGQFEKLKCPYFVNSPNFVTIFCRGLKMKIIFFDIPSKPPPIAVWNSLTNKFFQKKIDNSVYFQTKNNAILKRREGSFQLFKLSYQYLVLSVYCTPRLSAKPNVNQEDFNIKYNLIETKLTFKIQKFKFKQK